MFSSPGKDALRILRPEEFPTRGLGQGQGVIGLGTEHVEQPLVHTAACGHGPALVIALTSIRGGGDHGVDEHVARSGVEGVHGLRRAGGGQYGHVAYAADILQKPRALCASI